MTSVLTHDQYTIFRYLLLEEYKVLNTLSDKELEEVSKALDYFSLTDVERNQRKAIFNQSKLDKIVHNILIKLGAIRLGYEHADTSDRCNLLMLKILSCWKLHLEKINLDQNVIHLKGDLNSSNVILIADTNHYCQKTQTLIYACIHQLSKNNDTILLEGRGGLLSTFVEGGSSIPWLMNLTAKNRTFRGWEDLNLYSSASKLKQQYGFNRLQVSLADMRTANLLKIIHEIAPTRERRVLAVAGRGHIIRPKTHRMPYDILEHYQSIRSLSLQ